MPVLAYVGIRLGSHHQLEQYKRELRSQGEKLTFAELAPPVAGLDDREFAFVAAAKRLPDPKIVPGAFDLLSEASPGLTHRLPSLPAIPTIVHSNQLPVSNVASWESLAEAIAARSDELNLIREFLQRPPARTQVDYNDIFNPPKFHYLEKRLAAQWLGGSVLLHLRSNNMEAAIADLRSVLAITQWHSEEPSLVNQMIRTAVAGLACDVTWQVLAHDVTPLESDLKSLQESLQRIDLITALERGMLGERNWGLLLFDFNRKESGNVSKSFAALGLTPTGKPPIPSPTAGDHMLGFAWRHTVANEDERFYLQCMQRYVEAIRSFHTTQNRQNIQRTLDAHATELSEVAESWQLVRYPISGFSIPNFIKAHVTCARNETQRRLTVTAIALKRYELRYGHLPPNLNSLVPELVTAIPLDPMDAKPLKYKPNPDGTYLLYSVGEDGIDSGGDPTSTNSASEYGLWRGRDAVWPTPAR